MLKYQHHPARRYRHVCTKSLDTPRKNGPAFPAIFVFIALIIAELALIRRKKTDYDNGSPLPMFVFLGVPLGVALLVLYLTAPQMIR